MILQGFDNLKVMALSAGIEPATQTPEVHVISTSPRERAFQIAILLKLAVYC